MQEVIGQKIGFALMLAVPALVFLSLFSSLSAGKVYAGSVKGRIVETRNFQSSVEGCRRGFNPPKVHTLPSGLGNVSVTRCFNNGFETIPPHAEVIGTCYIEVIKDEQWDWQQERDPEVIKIIRQKYTCRFKGAGAVLGNTGEINRTGEKVYFSGEEPKNFKAKDPGCQAVFEEIKEQEEGEDETYKLIRR